MKLKIVFDKTGDSVDLEVIYNHDLIEFFVDKANKTSRNQFYNDYRFYKQTNQRLNEINWAVCKINEVFCSLADQSFTQNSDLLGYLDQKFLNRQHEQWVNSQNILVDIDRLRFSSDPESAKIGYKLHELCPDSIRKIRLAEALDKIGYLYPYEEVNMTVHRLESLMGSNQEFSGQTKWEIFENPFADSMVSNLDKVNFSFGYTYVGRQYYDKWNRWDTELEFNDHYNYETLEWSFHFNLGRPQTIPYSQEFLAWVEQKNAKPIATQIPIANVVDLEKNLTYYRSMLYKNSQQNNAAKLLIH